MRRHLVGVLPSLCSKKTDPGWDIIHRHRRTRAPY
jgi:hypothetical protein